MSSIYSDDVKANIIDKLTSPEYANLAPLPYFENYAEQFGGSLTDDPTFYEPLYPDIEDMDAKHDTSKVDIIYFNDFDFCLDEDRDRMSKLIRMDFNGDTFETIASCECGYLHGNEYIGKMKTCIKCGGEVELLVESDLENKVWVRLPEGVKTFINPGFYKTFFTRITIPTPKLEIVTWLIDPTYRRMIGKKDTQSFMKLNRELTKLGVQPGLNNFYANCDRIMEHFLIGEGRTSTSLSAAVSQRYFEFYQEYRDRIFCKHLPVPNKIMTIIERSGKEAYSFKEQMDINAIYQSIADTRDTSDFYRVTENDIKESEGIVGKSIVKLAHLASANNKENLFKKKGLSRRHIAAGSLPFTSRSVITSQTGIMDPSFIIAPWVTGLAQLEKHIISYLYRRGYTPTKAERLMRNAYYEIDPVIDEFFYDMERNRDGLAIVARQPSIDYGSAKAHFVKINRDLGDLSLKIPITGVSEWNADFDGDQMAWYYLADLESKAKAYGAFGHHRLLDENKLFRISRHANQPATNLINLNSTMRHLRGQVNK